jgi:hypothetical protein
MNSFMPASRWSPTLGISSQEVIRAPQNRPAPDSTSCSRRRAAERLAPAVRLRAAAAYEFNRENSSRQARRPDLVRLAAPGVRAQRPHGSGTAARHSRQQPSESLAATSKSKKEWRLVDRQTAIREGATGNRRETDRQAAPRRDPHAFDWLVVGQILATNPAHAVRGPKHVVRRGKTPVLTEEQPGACSTASTPRPWSACVIARRSA